MSLGGCGDDDGSGADGGATGVDASTGADASAGGDAGAPSDAGSLSDGGAGGGSFAGCEGSGDCSTLSEAACSYAMALGCEPTYERFCNIRGCTGFDQRTCGTRDTGCIWNEAAGRCEDDPGCAAQTTMEACTSRGCSWVETLAEGCSGTWDCSALDSMITGADAGAVPNACERGSTPFGLSCTTRYE
ncbi:MAG: hypothetical protein CMN31_14990 [Sandaracinus sp.]|nr:hypothetical protein [Myxococcales bacterium]MAT26798.1 hypothetical protein [Sandaracinus sp.]MBJ72619.1 hypothetical protein [Sandaracinus sp.]